MSNDQIALSTQVKDLILAEKAHEWAELQGRAQALHALNVEAYLMRGIDIRTARSPTLVEAMYRRGWLAVQWHDGKPGWRVLTTNRCETYVQDSEVIAVLEEAAR